MDGERLGLFFIKVESDAWHKGMCFIKPSSELLATYDT